MFKKGCLIFAILLINAANAREIVIETLPSPQFMDSSGSLYTPDVTSYPKITQAEQTILGQSFVKEPVEMRLSRLEKKMFNKTFDGYPLSKRTDNVLGFIQESAIDKNSLSSLEKTLLSKSYGNETPGARIGRLEQYVFGATQGGDLDSRLQTLKTAAESYSPFPSQQSQRQFGGFNNNYNNGNRNFASTPYGYGYGQKHSLAKGVFNSIPTTTPRAGKIKSTVGSVASFFMGGNPTGWTPQIDPFSDTQTSPYAPSYNAPSYNQTYQQGYSPYQPQYPSLYQPQYQQGQQYQQQYPQAYQQAHPQAYQQQYQQPYSQQHPQGVQPQYFDLFSNGSNGSATYYDDGRYRKDMRGSNGGASVTILR